jgi:hypothetical protein
MTYVRGLHLLSTRVAHLRNPTEIRGHLMLLLIDIYVLRSHEPDRLLAAFNNQPYSTASGLLECRHG